MRATRYPITSNNQYPITRYAGNPRKLTNDDSFASRWPRCSESSDKKIVLSFCPFLLFLLFLFFCFLCFCGFVMGLEEMLAHLKSIFFADFMPDPAIQSHQTTHRDSRLPLKLMITIPSLSPGGRPYIVHILIPTRCYPNQIHYPPIPCPILLSLVSRISLDRTPTQLWWEGLDIQPLSLIIKASDSPGSYPDSQSSGFDANHTGDGL